MVAVNLENMQRMFSTILAYSRYSVIDNYYAHLEFELLPIL